MQVLSAVAFGSVAMSVFELLNPLNIVCGPNVNAQLLWIIIHVGAGRSSANAGQEFWAPAHDQHWTAARIVYCGQGVRFYHSPPTERSGIQKGQPAHLVCFCSRMQAGSRGSERSRVLCETHPHFSCANRKAVGQLAEPCIGCCGSHQCPFARWTPVAGVAPSRESATQEAVVSLDVVKECWFPERWSRSSRTAFAHRQ